MEIIAIVFASYEFHYQKVVEGPHDREWEEISSMRQFSLKIRHTLWKKLKKNPALSENTFFLSTQGTHGTRDHNMD